MALKAGRMADFEDSMAKAMEDALRSEWSSVRGGSLPEAGQQDRRLLFVAIARGILEYLEEHQDEIIVSLRLGDTLGSYEYTVEHLDLNT